jgi:hypothetical protein
MPHLAVIDGTEVKKPCADYPKAWIFRYFAAEKKSYLNFSAVLYVFETDETCPH